MTTGEKLRRAIARKYGKSITQREAASRLKVPTGTLSEWLGDKYEPTLGSLRGLAAELECSVTSLVGEEAA